MNLDEKKKIIVIMAALLLLIAATVLAVTLWKAAESGFGSGQAKQTTTQAGSTAATPTDTQGATGANSQPATTTTEQNSTTTTEQNSPKPTEQNSTKPSVQDPTKPSAQEPTNPTVQNPTPPTEPVPPETTLPAVTPTVPDDIEGAPTVTLPTETNPDTGENVGVQLPCEVPGESLLIEKIAPYSGIYVEDGTNSTVENVAMMLVTNIGDAPVEFTVINAQYEGGELLFHLSTLPAGASAVVQAQGAAAIPDGKLLGCTATVIHRGDLSMSDTQVTVVDNGDGSLTVTNLTEQTIPTVRVFYKYYMEQENLFVGGISFTAKLNQLGAGESITLRPAHYSAGSSRVMMVTVYDTEQ